MAIGTCAGYYQVPGPGAIGLTLPDVRCLFQRPPAKLAIGEKRMPGVNLNPTEENKAVKTNHKLTLAVLAGASIGVVAAQAIHAQQAKVPPAYVIAEVEKDPTKIEDPAASRKYAEGAPKSLVPFNGQYLVRAGGSKIQTLE